MRYFKATLYDCPHCGYSLNITRTTLTEKSLVELLYTVADNHIKVCKYKKHNKIIQLQIEDTTKDNYSTYVDFIDIKMII